MPVVTIQLAVAVMFLQRHYEDVTDQMTGNMAREVALVRARPDLAGPLDIALTAPPLEDSIRPWDLSGRAMRARLQAEFDDLTTVDLVAQRKVVRLGFADGTGMAFSRDNVSAANPHQLLVLMVMVALLMTAISFLFMRGQIRPIRRLARAADAFGRGQPADYWPSGATEVRQAGMAFLEMRARIERHIEQRTLLLSGVSHDLRTPLTRMKLELGMMDAPEAEALSRDVVAMERIIDTFLEFARDDATDATEPTDLRALAAEVVAGTGAELAPGPPVTADVQPTAVSRALANLVANARRHGTRVRASVEAPPGAVVIRVEDDGPGIPEARRDDAVRPFARLDAARSNTAGNVGLGLAIVRDVARAHGGALRLGTSEMGGLSAEIVLPR